MYNFLEINYDNIKIVLDSFQDYNGFLKSFGGVRIVETNGRPTEDYLQEFLYLGFDKRQIVFQ